jgi:hypothetical protein
MQAKDPNNSPRLKVQPETLDFGKYHPNAPLTQQPVIKIKVTNDGTGRLSGRLVPMVSWLIPLPIEFSCLTGETSQHTVRISTGAPYEANRTAYEFEDVLLVTSNAGEHWYSGTYQPTGRTIVPVRSSAIWLIIPFSLVAIAAIILFLVLRPMGNTSTAQNFEAQSFELLFTQAAKTLFVEMTSTAALQKADAQQAVLIQLPSPVATSLFAPTATFTPWPFQEFTNPEIFIQDYYLAVDSGDYEKSWNMLSPAFQQSCCQLAGNDPFVIYTHFWDNIDKVEVRSAKLQAWDTNPAIVYVTIYYQYTLGDSFEEFRVFSLISDPVKQTLLIDQVQ